MNNKTCIGFLCHIINDETIYRYNKLKKEAPEYYDIYWIINDSNYDFKSYNNINFIVIPSVDELKSKYKKVYYLYEKENDDFINSGYHFDCGLNFIEFRKVIRHYKYYWFIEYDVYMHNFNELFTKYDNDNYDVITSNISTLEETYDVRKYSEVYLYNSNNLYNIINYPIQLQYHAFYTISRLSDDILDEMMEYHKGYNFTFFEDLITMIAIHKGYKIKNNDFCNNNGYNDGSNSWSENYVKDEYFNSNIIIHPIKLEKHINELEKLWKPI